MTAKVLCSYAVSFGLRKSVEVQTFYNGKGFRDHLTSNFISHMENHKIEVAQQFIVKQGSLGLVPLGHAAWMGMSGPRAGVTVILSKLSISVFKKKIKTKFYSLERQRGRHTHRHTGGGG